MRQKIHKDIISGWVPFTDKEINRYLSKGYWHNLTVGDALDRIASLFPDKLAIVDDKTQVTWKELRERSNRLAFQLIRLGINYGDFFVLQLPNMVEFFYLYFAFNRIGAIPIMCLPRHRRREVDYELKLHEAKGICVPTGEPFDYVGMVEEIKGDHPYLKLFLTTGGPAPDGWLSLEKLLEEDIEGQFPVDYLSTLKPDPNDISTEQLSGGTTGLPKGIPRTHNDYLCQWFAFGSILGFNKDAVFLLVAPVAHNAGLLLSGSVVVNGGTLIMTKSPKIGDMLRLIEKYRITHTFFVPVQITYLMEAGELRKKYDLSSLKVVGSGAQKVKPELSIWLAQELGVHPIHVFGMAEGPVICNSWLSPLEAQAHTIGTPPFDDPEDIQTKIVDPQGKEVKPGEVGEMISKGPFTFKGYFRAPEENAKAFDQEGFFYSGDLMSRRPDGRYVVEGRSKDMIIRGGENIYPEGVEQVLMEHPKVITAFCVGMPDPALGEQLCAFVQLVKGEQFTIEEMRNYMKAQGMAVYQWPERLELVEGWPLTPFQKIDKRLLRAFITAKLYQEGKIDKALGDEYLKKDKLSLEDLLTGQVKISLEGMPT